MVDQQFGIKRVGVIVVNAVAEVERHIPEVAIVSILRKEHHILGADLIDDSPGYGGLSRTGAAADTNNHKRDSITECEGASGRGGEGASGRGSEPERID